MPIRILLVDDFEPWRRLVRSMLQNDSELLVICEASDGLAAVHSANEMKPDLILLDLDLPKQNGIDTARKIRKLVPKSKILFLSEESSVDVVQQTLFIGSGFVVKTDAAKDLLPGIRSVIFGRQFLSISLEGHEFIEGSSPIISAGVQ